MAGRELTDQRACGRHAEERQILPQQKLRVAQNYRRLLGVPAVIFYSQQAQAAQTTLEFELRCPKRNPEQTEAHSARAHTSHRPIQKT